MINITHIDHLVLTVKNIPASVDFYVRVLGMQNIEFGDNRTTLKFDQKKMQPA